MLFEDFALDLSERIQRGASWLLGRLRKLSPQRVAQATRGTVRSYLHTGRHRKPVHVHLLDTRHQTIYAEDSTGGITVQTPRRRHPVTVLRSHLPRAKQKEAALVSRLSPPVDPWAGPVAATFDGYRTRILAARRSDDLIAAVELYLQQAALYQEALHPMRKQVWSC